VLSDPDIADPNFDYRQSASMQDFLRRGNPTAQNTMVSYDQAIATLKAAQTPNQNLNTTSPYLNPAQAQGIQTALNTIAAPTTPTAPVTAAPRAGLTSLIERPKDITATPLSDLGSEYDAMLAANPGMSAEDAMARREKMLGTDTGREEVRQKLKDMEEKTSKDEEKAPWMALMKAGLATMAGTSPYALSNIGKGGIEGMADYAAAQDRVEKARDKQLAVNQQLAAQDRAEKQAAVDYGLHSEEHDKERAEKIRLDALATKAHVQTTNATNDLAAQEHNVNAQLEYGKAKEQEAYHQGELHKIDIQLERAKATEDKAAIQALTQRITEGLNAAVKTHDEAYKADQTEYPKSAEFKENTALIRAYQTRLAALTGINYKPTAPMNFDASRLPYSGGSGKPNDPYVYKLPQQ